MCPIDNLKRIVFRLLFGSIICLDFRNNTICIAESFDTNISHQLFDYTITFMNPQHLNSNSKGDILLKNRIKSSF